MNNVAIKTYKVEDGPIRKTIIKIDLDELDKHPEILGEELTNYLKIMNLLSICTVDLKNAYEYAACSERLTAMVDKGYEALKDVLGKDVADAAKYLGVEGYVIALLQKENKAANNLVKYTNYDVSTLESLLNDIVNLLANGASVEEIAQKTNNPVSMVKIYLEELKK